MAAGCAAYGRSPALGDVSLQYAQAMARNNGNLTPNTEALLNDRGFSSSSLGEMDFYNPNGATPQDALNFWNSKPTKDLISNCGMQQMEVSVWMLGNGFAASSIMGTPNACFTSNGISPSTQLTASYNSCNGQVQLQYPAGQNNTTHYNIGFGQRPAGGDIQENAVFSGQWDRDSDKPRSVLFGTRPAGNPVVAYFRVQACGTNGIFGSTCNPWGDFVAIDLGNNELVAR
jgi:hypothetical protein